MKHFQEPRRARPVRDLQNWVDRTPDPHALQDRRILIIEDEVFTALDVALTLEAAGANVTSVPSIRAALAAVAETDQHGRPYDAALLDLVVRDRTSEDVATALRERGVPFIVYTGNAISWKRLIQKLGAPVISKPVLPEEVADALASMLAS